VVSGDPKSENVIYNIDSRTFEHEGEPDLGVIHIHCPEDPKAINDPTNYPGYLVAGGPDSEDLAGYPQVDGDVDSSDQEQSIRTRQKCKEKLSGPDSPPLSDTDFEHELNVIFQISDQPRSFMSREDAKLNRAGLNKDFLWSAIGHKDMTQEQVDYERYQGSGARQAYRKMWVQYNDTGYDDFSPENPRNDPFDVYYDAYRFTYSGGKSCPYTEPWFGEVGRMVIWKAQTAPRDFMWTLHDEIEADAKGGETGSSDQVEKRDVKKTKPRKASPACPHEDDPLTTISVTLKFRTILMSVLFTSFWMATSRQSSWTRTILER